MRCFVACISVAVLAWCSVGRAEESLEKNKEAEVEKVAAVWLKAGEQRDWEKYVDLLHPDSVRDFHKLALVLVKLAEGKSTEEQASILPLFARVKELKAIREMEPKAVVASFLQGTAALMPAGAGKKKSTVIGTVFETPALAHVVCRIKARLGKAEFNKIEVVTVRQTGEAWKIVLPEEILRLAEQMQQSFGAAVETIGPVKDEAQPEP